jgi:23S rRNA pseudouridine2605 synthase
LTRPVSTGSRPPGPDPADRGERLQRVLARAGLGSRRSTEDLIRDGRVRIGRRVARLGDRVDPKVDRVSVDGAPIPVDPDLRYLAFNKPPGVTTTLRDPHAARSLAGFLPPGPRVFPVGRLDRDSEGLLLLTNDGDLAFRLQHPRYGVEKEYLLEVPGAVSRKDERALADGIELDDGFSRPMRVGPVHRTGTRTAITIVMAEGRKREIRRMLAALGYAVARLLRVRVGPVRLGKLAPGKSRPLTRREVEELYRATGLTKTGTPQRFTRGPRSSRDQGRLQ